LRGKWAEHELGWTGARIFAPRTQPFWDEALSPEPRKVAWLSRRCAMEYTGFLEWLWRLGDEPCEIIDLTDVLLSFPPKFGPPFPTSLGLLSAKQIGDDRLLDQARDLPSAVRDQDRALWEKLRAENAALRVLRRDVLISAPISFFDSLLMSNVSGTLRKVSRVVGTTMGCEIDGDVCQSSDLFLASRISALVKAGRLEQQGRSALDMRYCEVRLPSAR
jgi:Protein of unknown function